jgi:hypothetical protein
MMYRIVWKNNGQIYTEYKDLDGVKYLLDWLDAHFDSGFELISVTLNLN